MVIEWADLGSCCLPRRSVNIRTNPANLCGIAYCCGIVQLNASRNYESALNCFELSERTGRRRGSRIKRLDATTARPDSV